MEGSKQARKEFLTAGGLPVSKRKGSEIKPQVGGKARRHQETRLRHTGGAKKNWGRGLKEKQATMGKLGYDKGTGLQEELPANPENGFGVKIGERVRRVKKKRNPPRRQKKNFGSHFTKGRKRSGIGGGGVAKAITRCYPEERVFGVKRDLSVPDSLRESAKTSTARSQASLGIRGLRGGRAITRWNSRVQI